MRARRTVGRGVGSGGAGWRERARCATPFELHPLIARVLVARGYSDVGRARGFLAPRLADLTQPECMADRDVAADRIASAIRGHERIAIFGDYDVDGTSSAALLASVLKSLGADVVAVVASRFDGGYGLSAVAMERVAALRPSLLITCDCGTSDHDRLATLRARGVDSIVVDHHKVPGEALPAVAFLNPHRPDCGFPFKGLASVGLALSVAAAVRAKLGSTLDLRTYLDLVAVGTIADVMPLEGDNRILTRVGLERLAAGHGRAGLQALAREARLRARVSAHDVGFSIAPMLNAPGRLGAATPTLELLLCDDDRVATEMARQLCAANDLRRQISTALTAEANEQVRQVYGDAPDGIVVGGDGWHPGVGGIVAGRLAERWNAPAIVLAFENGMGTGSGARTQGVCSVRRRCHLRGGPRAVRRSRRRGGDARAQRTVRSVARWICGCVPRCAVGTIRARCARRHGDRRTRSVGPACEASPCAGADGAGAPRPYGRGAKRPRYGMADRRYDARTRQCACWASSPRSVRARWCGATLRRRARIASGRARPAGNAAWRPVQRSGRGPARTDRYARCALSPPFQRRSMAVRHQVFFTERRDLRGVRVCARARAPA